MKILDFLQKGSIIADLRSTGKAEVLAELADCIAKAEQIDRNEVLRILSDRERLGSTGIGDGVAIPHGTMSSITHLVALFGRSVKGVDFDAIDNKCTHIFFVLLTPDNNVGLQALARVSRMLRKAEFRELLKKATDTDEIYRVVATEDERL